jgi:restriction system protein
MGELLPARLEIGHDPSRNTNKRLAMLLQKYFKMQLADTFATNVFPFVKLGSMGARIGPRHLQKAALEFAIPQIKIIGPVTAVCLGKAAFNAVKRASGQPGAKTLRDAIDNPFELGDTTVWCQHHPGRNTVNQVASEWARMASAHDKKL